MEQREQLIALLTQTFRGGKFARDLESVGGSLDRTIREAVDGMYPEEPKDHRVLCDGERALDL